MALVLAPVLPELLGDHQVVLGMHVLKRPLVVSRSGHSLYSILLAFHNQRSSVKKGLYCKHKGLSVVVCGVLGPPCQVRHIGRYPCFSEVLESTYEVRLRAIVGRHISSKSYSSL